MSSTKSIPVDIALQGGGSHGAFTWGVLDRLLADDRIKIDAVSGTSAGAMNACAVVEGLAKGGPDAARKKLETYWRAVSNASRFIPIRRSYFDRMMGSWSLANSPAFMMSKNLMRYISPYKVNPIGVNPLRDVVDKRFDFEAINA